MPLGTTSYPQSGLPLGHRAWLPLAPRGQWAGGRANPFWRSFGFTCGTRLAIKAGKPGRRRAQGGQDTCFLFSFSLPLLTSCLTGIKARTETTILSARKGKLQFWGIWRLRLLLSVSLQLPQAEQKGNLHLPSPAAHQ